MGHPRSTGVAAPAEPAFLHDDGRRVRHPRSPGVGAPAGSAFLRDPRICPAAAGVALDAAKTRKLRKDLRLLAVFVRIFCDRRHGGRLRRPFELATHDVERICRRRPALCAECSRLLAHAFVKRSLCPLDPKPMCKHCPQHCYVPAYRERMREVMRESGRALILSGRLDYLFHYFF